MGFSFSFKSNYKLLLHILFWVFQFSLFFVLDLKSQNLSGNSNLILLETVKNTVIPAFIFYCLFYFIIPQFLLKNRYWLFAILLFIVFIVASIMDTYAWRLIYNHLSQVKAIEDNKFFVWIQERGLWSLLDIRILVNKFFVFTRFLSLPIIIKASKMFYSYKSKKNDLEKQYLKQELFFLKSQINPHVLFNSFNNLYSLIIQGKVDLSAKLLEKLSSFLRKILYEGKDEFSLIHTELEIIDDYVEIEKIRNENLLVEYDKKILAKFEQKKIPTMLLFPIVENAFKHCKKTSKYHFVRINIEVHDNALCLHATNSHTINDTKKSVGGIGKANVEKRLNIYYTNKYKLKRTISDNIYNLNLEIEI